MLVVRVSNDTRVGIEALAATQGTSMSALIDKAARRAIALSNRPHVEALVGAIVTHAQDCERDGLSIAADPDASRKFHSGMAKILERYTAVPAQETETLRIDGWLSAETAMALADRGVDWSQDIQQWTKTVLSSIKKARLP
jgi:hypothetical protein